VLTAAKNAYLPTASGSRIWDGIRSFLLLEEFLAHKRKTYSSDAVSDFTYISVFKYTCIVCYACNIGIGVPPYERVTPSKTNHSYVKPLIKPKDIYRVIEKDGRDLKPL
jgi:hypothetical protein